MDALPFSRLEIVRQSVPIDYPFSPKSLAEHLKKKRYDSKLRQIDLARSIGVSEDCIRAWENGLSAPQVQYYHAIIHFLGFNPFVLSGDSLSDNVKNYRFQNGLTQKSFARLVGLDARSVNYLEKGEHIPSSRTKALLARHGIK